MAEEKIKSLEDHIRKLEGELRVTHGQLRDGGNSNSVVVNSSKDRKIDKFTSSMDVDEWVSNVELHVNKKYSSEQEKVIFIWDKLTEDIKTELRLQIDQNKSSSSELLVLLKSVYGVKKSPFELEMEFYAMNQSPGDTLTAYSHDLMKLLFLLQKQAPHMKKHSDKMLKQKFADGVVNNDLKRELKRLNRENENLKFYELRDLATDWVKDSKLDTGKIDSLMEMISLQQQQIQTLSEGMSKQTDLISQVEEQQTKYSYPRGNFVRSRGRSRGISRGISRGRGWNRDRSDNVESKPQEFKSNDNPVICHYCSEPNHISPNCWKRRNDRRREQEKKSLNESHSSWGSRLRVENS